MRLSSLFEERGDAYANANARVSLESKCSLWPFVVIPQKKKIEMKFRSSWFVLSVVQILQPKWVIEMYPTSHLLLLLLRFNLLLSFSILDSLVTKKKKRKSKPL